MPTIKRRQVLRLVTRHKPVVQVHGSRSMAQRTLVLGALEYVLLKWFGDERGGFEVGMFHGFRFIRYCPARRRDFLSFNATIFFQCSSDISLPIILRSQPF